MEEKIKVNDSDLNEMKDLQMKFAKLAQEFGAIEFRILSMENQKTQIKEAYYELEKMSQEIEKKFIYKYGRGNLDMSTGEIALLKEETPPPASSRTSNPTHI